MNFSSILRTSQVLKKARAGNVGASMKVAMADPRAVELAGMTGFDAVWLCHEHAPNDWLNLENQVRAANLHDMDAVIRVSRGSYSDYIRAFEMGAQGIMVPHVRTAQEAKNIIKMLRFYPMGERAIDGGSRDGGYAMLPPTEYVNYSNAERFIILQIESPEALENVEEIASVAGYEFLMFGPGDFAHRIGQLGNISHPAVLAARSRVEDAALKHDKWIVSAGVPTSEAKESRERGCRLFNLGADIRALSEYNEQKLEDLRNALA